MPIIAKSLRTIHRELAIAMGDLVGEGTVASPTASQVSTQDLVQQRTDQIRGHHMYFHTGAGNQQDRVLSAFTPYSIAGQYAVIQALRPWSPVASTNTEFYLHRLFSGIQYNQAIIQAVRRAMRRQLLAKFDNALVLNSRLLNPKFEVWSAGTASAPDSWTLNGTGAAVARESSIVYPNTLYSAKVTNGGSEAAWLNQQVADYPNFKGLNFSLTVRAFTATASRVRVRVTDGVNTWDSDYHDGQGAKDLTILDKTLANNLSDFDIQLRTEVGSAITAYWLKATLDCDGHRYEYPLNTWPSAFVYVDSVYMEGDKDGVFNIFIPDDYWYINRETKRLCFIRGLFTPTAGKVLEVRGQAHPIEPAAEADSVEADNEYVLRRAGAYLLESLPWGSVDSEGLRERYVAWRDGADRLESTMTTRARPNARIVEGL